MAKGILLVWPRKAMASFWLPGAPLPNVSPEATLVGEEAMVRPGLGLGALVCCPCLAV